jgi:hypothetical protein
MVSRLNGMGSSGRVAHPDKYGTLEYQEIGHPYTQLETRNVEQPQYYLTAIDRNTLEAHVTLDLHEVMLLPFLTSLNVVLQEASSYVTPGTRLRMGPSVADEDRIRYLDYRVSIRGDNLAIDEVLDTLYQNSGCIVDRKAEQVMLASCP